MWEWDSRHLPAVTVQPTEWKEPGVCTTAQLPSAVLCGHLCVVSAVSESAFFQEE